MGRGAPRTSRSRCSSAGTSARRPRRTPSRWSTAASATSSTRTSPGCGSPAASAPRSSASLPTSCGRCPFVIPTYGPRDAREGGPRGSRSASSPRRPSTGTPGSGTPSTAFRGQRSCRARNAPRGSAVSSTATATGAGVFYDGQLRNPPRLVLAIVRVRGARGRRRGQLLRGEEPPAEGRTGARGRGDRRGERATGRGARARSSSTRPGRSRRSS